MNVSGVTFLRYESIEIVEYFLLINIESTFDSIPLAVEFMIGMISCR